MSGYDFMVARNINAEGYPFYALIMAAMFRADTVNGLKLRQAFPEIWTEVDTRYNAPAWRDPAPEITGH